MKLKTCAEAIRNKPWLAPQILKVMKLTAILMTIACLQVSAKVFSQITLSGKDIPLSTVFSTIQQQSGYTFFYKDKLVENLHVNAELHNATLEQALRQVLDGLPLTYNIVDKTVAIKQAEPSVIDRLKTALNIPITITGKVQDELGQPMPGVTVRQKGTNNVTTTDANGLYSINVPDDKTIVVFSFVGYEPQELQAKDVSAGSVITLKAAVNNLREVVINKGYYNERQEYSTGDVSIVSAKTIEEQPVSDPLLALEGRVPGLQITQTSGVPGAYSTVRLRGQNTIMLNKPVTAADPLYIIDGIPFSSLTLTSPYIGGGIFNKPVQNSGPNKGVGEGMSPFNSINPADIESIEVLKDADATAIYGSRGANGVIIITTKKGKAGKLKTDVNVLSGVSQVTRFFDLLNTQQYLEMRKEAFKNDGQLGRLIPQNASTYPDLLLWDTTRYTNWQKVLIGNSAAFNSANVNLSGGTTNTQFLVGAGYNRQGTTMPGDYSDNRASMHFSLSNSSADQRFQSQLTANYSNDNSNLPATKNLISSITLPPDAPPLYDANGNLNWAVFNGRNTWNNPLAYTRANANALTEFYQANLNLSYQLLRGLYLTTNLGYTHSQMNQEILAPGSGNAPQISNNPAFRSSTFSTSNNGSWIIEPKATYTSQIGKGRVEFLLGTTFQSSSFDSRGLIASGFSSDALISNIQAASTIRVAGSTESEYHYNAIYARAGYVLADKYLINLTGRRDGSSRFGPDKQFGNFGAIGVGWIFSKERWVADNFSLLSFGKLRGSYGITGSDAIGDYQFLSTYSPTGVSYQGAGGLSPTLLANPDYRWEENKKIEMAMDLGFLKDRFNFSINWYRDRTDNQLVTTPLPSSTGFGGVTANLPALIQNTGWEFVVSSTNITSESFSWRTSGSLSINRDKLVSFPGIENTPYFDVYFVGYPLGVQQLYHYTGVDPQTGAYTFATKDGSGNPNISSQPATNDATILKAANLPSFQGGLENSISFKGIQLDFFFQFTKQQGRNYLYSFGRNSPGTAMNEPAEVLGRWQQPGSVTNIERFSASNQVSYQYQLLSSASDAFITDASFIRLKNLSLSYNLPLGWTKRVHVNSCRIFLQGQNIFTLTKYRGLDPETQGLSMPPMRTITAGMQLSL